MTATKSAKFYDSNTYDILALLDVAADGDDDGEDDSAEEADADPSDEDIHDRPTMEDLGACSGRKDKDLFTLCATGIYGTKHCRWCGRPVRL